MLNTLRNYHDGDISAVIRGTDVYGAGEEKIGSAEDAIINSDSGDLRYLIVNASWLKSRRFIIPADHVYAYGDSDDLYANLSKKDVEALPEFQDGCLTSEEAFTTYERDYQSAWHSQSDPARVRPSQRLLRLRQRIHDAFSRTASTVSEQERKRPKYAEASYSGSIARPTSVYGLYSDRKNVESTISALKGHGFASTDISVYLRRVSEPRYEQGICCGEEYESA